MASESVVCSQVDDLCRNITRHLNCLQDDNRNTRKRALEAIRKEVLPFDNVPDGQKGVVLTVMRPLLHVFADPVEKCRELAIVTVTELVRSHSEASELLQYIVPSLVQRLGQPDVVEPSEELRLKLVELLSLLIDLTTTHTAPYLDDFIRILQRTIVDPFPEVKKESCACASKLAKAIPQYFHMQSESLIKPLIVTISHQHSRVRVATITAIGDVIQYGNGKSVDDVVSHLAQRLFDATPVVRSAVTQVVGRWLLDLLDRYSYHHKLIPLLLTSLLDEMPDIRNQAEGLWHDVGLKYSSENENDLKDKMDFAQSEIDHYPPEVDRPNLGCRMLIYHNFSKILSGLTNDISDWVVGTRIKSAQLLYLLLLNEEHNVTQHLDKVLGCLYKSINDEEQAVVEYVLKSAEILGYFVRPEAWCKVLLQNVKMSQSAGSIAILAAVIRGSQKSLLQTHLDDITSVISDPGVCHIAESNLQSQLLVCVKAIILVMGSDCEAISFELFNIMICVLALHRSENIKSSASSLLATLASVQGFGDNGLVELYRRHMVQILHSMKSSYQSWTQHSLERVVFDTLLLEAGPVIGTVLDDVIPILTANLDTEKDAEVRNKFFTLLSRLMLDADRTLNSDRRFGEFVVTVVRDMIVPNCVWRAGRTAAAIRKAAVACLWALVKSRLLSREQLIDVMEDLLTQLRSTLEDDSKDTRLISCRVLLHLFSTVGRDLDQDRLHNLYPDLLKRLDDSSDDIRIAMAQTFCAYIECFRDNYDVILYRAHIEAIYSGLLVHLDDPDRSIQQAVAGTLQRAASIAPDVLLKLIDVVKHKHRSTAYCDQLTQFIHSLPKPDSP